jgi:hypothetical protein
MTCNLTAEACLAHLAADSEATDPRRYLAPARAAVADAVAGTIAGLNAP